MEIIELYNRTTASTSVVFQSGADKFVNDIGKRTYIGSAFLAGRSKKDIYAGGIRIKDRLLLETRSALNRRRPGQKVEVGNPGSHNDHSLHWAYYDGQLRWDEVEIAHNVDETKMSRKGMKTYVKDVMVQKEQDLYANLINDYDDLFFAKPNAGLMEHLSQADGESPMMVSIPVFINEEANGLYTGYSDTNGDFSTIMGIDPTVYTRWVPQQVTYDYANYSDVTNASNLFAALDLMARRTHFKPPTKFNKYFQGDTPVDRFMCITGEDGATLHSNAMRANGEFFLTDGKQDGSYSNSKARGIDIMEYQDLDNAELYDDGSNGLTTQDSAAAPGPRFYFINLDYMWTKFFAGKFFNKGKVKELADTDGAFRQPVFLWTQLWCSSRRRHGIVYPSS